MLLAQIKSNYSSGAESSSDNEGADKEPKSSDKVKKEEEEQQGTKQVPLRSCSVLSGRVSSQTTRLLSSEDEDSEVSSSDVEVKKRGKRHKLLRHKLSLSEGESGEEKAASKEKKKGGKKKSGQKGWF